MANDENLIPARKGDVRNPNGKPKGTKNRATILKEFLGLKLKNNPDSDFDLPEGVTVEQGIMLALIKKASEGDVAAIKELQDTLHGKMTDKVETEISLTKMGDVMLAKDGGEIQALEFDVGEDVKAIDAE